MSTSSITIDSQSNTQTVGNFVTDVSLNPYIAARIISFYAHNLRPNTLIHIFFDSVLVDKYCAPATLANAANVDTSTYTSTIANGTWGTAIYSDSVGTVIGQFNIPSSTFKTGDRILTITNVSSLSLGIDAVTTMASATFTASNLTVTKQLTTLTTINPQLKISNTIPTIISTNTVINSVPIVVTDTTDTTWEYQYGPPIVTSYNETGDDPIAQSLWINTPGGEAGIYVTAIDIFFQQKSMVGAHGVSLYLCETNNGYPAGDTILPFSVVHVSDANINVSLDASVATTFTFEAPVFLQNKKEYAFVVRPDANDPDFFVYSAKLGDLDIASRVQVFSQPTLGTAFYGATTTEWTALQSEYIKFNLYRANFTATAGDAYFTDNARDYIGVSSVTYINSTAGVLPGDVVFGATNSTPSTANVSIFGTLSLYNTSSQNLHIANSTANFNTVSFVQIHRFANSTLTPNTSTIIAWANTTGFYNPVMDAVVPHFATVSPAGTKISYALKGMSNTDVMDTTEQNIIIGTETELRDKERIVPSRTQEYIATSGGNTSLIFHANLKSDTAFLSPIIDTVRNKQLIIKNCIDPVSFNFDEFYNYGNSQSKYVSIDITLAPGQDAQDLQVILSAYRPIGTDIQVWAKFVNNEDSDSMTNKVWTPFSHVSASQYCNPSNPNDFQEFTFKPTILYPMFGKIGTVTANNSSANVTGVGTTFTTDYKVGWWVNMAANSTWNESSRQITTITNNTFMVLSAPFTNNYTSNTLYLVVPPTTAWLSTNSSSQITGTVTANSTTNIVTGSGTNFTGQLIKGAIIGFGGDSQEIVSITNTTQLVVGTPWSSNVAGANAYHISPNGISYLNSSGVLYTSFIKFKIKIILQSNDSSQVPIIDDLRVLAMQL